jgi:4-amino-4-deoxy-L-arabinose transferase-like glycosyltransferase
MDDRTAHVCLAVILVVGLALAAAFYSGPLYTMDDGSLIAIAKNMLYDNFSMTSSPFALSYLPSALVYASFEAFGISTVSAILPSIIEYVALILLAFLVGKTLFNNEVGVISGVLIITMPNVLGVVTRVVPDLLLGVLTGFMMYALALAAKHKEREQGLYLSAGLICGLMAFAKLGGVGLAIPVVVAVFFLDRKLVVPFAAGLLISLLIYTATFYALGGWKTGIISAVEGYSQNQVRLTQADLQTNYVTMLDVITGPVVLLQVLPFGLILLFIFLSTYIGLKNRNKALLFAASMFWFTFLYLFFGTESMQGYVFITVVTKYFLLVSIPMAVLAAYLLFDIYSASHHHLGKGIALTLLALLIALVLISNLPAYTAVYVYKLYILHNSLPLV